MNPRLRKTLEWIILGSVITVLLVIVLWPYPKKNHLTNTIANDTPLTRLRNKLALPPCELSKEHITSGPIAHLHTTCLSTGSEITIGDLIGGKPTLINFWAYWCTPCKKELPLISSYAQIVNGRVRILLIHRDPSDNGGLTTAAKYGITLPIVTDHNGEIASALGLPNTIPQSVVINPDGSVAKVIHHIFRSINEIGQDVGIQ